jgi:hypothetical protein
LAEIRYQRPVISRGVLSRAALVFIFITCSILLGPTASTGEEPACLSMRKHSSSEEVLAAARIKEDELLARLIYAEGASTGFPDEDAVYEAIAWGVMNRVRLGDASPSLQKVYGKGIRGVIFKPGQFNPAVSKRSQFSGEFLCPGDPRRWSMAQAAAMKAIRGEGNPFIVTDWERRHGISLVVNFYYPGSIQARKPTAPWENSRHLRFVGDVDIGRQPLSSEKVRFYRLSRPPGDVRRGYKKP